MKIRLCAPNGNMSTVFASRLDTNFIDDGTRQTVLGSVGMSKVRRDACHSTIVSKQLKESNTSQVRFNLTRFTGLQRLIASLPARFALRKEIVIRAFAFDVIEQESCRRRHERLDCKL